ncbi:MAG: hypothetical protein ISR64_11740 [Deltaproteobacteria bacterium]|nr:hypothetical protein [Deltaproteobacteria bacterium]
MGISNTWRRLLITLALVPLAVLALEAGLRFVALDDPGSWRDLSVMPRDQGVLQEQYAFDPVVGHTAAPHYRFYDKVGWPLHPIRITTVERGIRVNTSERGREHDLKGRTGGILAVGESFTFGSEADDHETWPAFLEGTLGFPVINAGADGHGIDQTFLRARQLVKATGPRWIVFGVVPDSVHRSQLSINGGFPKPYFDVEEGDLVLHDPRLDGQEAPLGAAGYSYLLCRLADLTGLVTRCPRVKLDFQVEHDRGVQVSCGIMTRLKALSQAHGAHALVFAQYPALQALPPDSGFEEDPSFDREGFREVLDCARGAGLEVVDSLPVLHRYFKDSFPGNPDRFWGLFVRHEHDGAVPTGHLSAAGNRMMAQLLASALKPRLESPSP